MATGSPRVGVAGWDGLLEELQLVHVEHDQVARTEDGHEHTQAAEDEGVKAAAQRPPGAQAQEDQEVDGRGQRWQHDA